MGIRARSILLCIILLCATSLPLACVLVMRSYDLGATQIRHHAEHYAEAMAHTLEPALLLDDRTALARILKGVTTHEAIVWSTVMDANGRVLDSSGRPPPDAEACERAGALPISSRVHEGNRYVCVTIPVRRLPQDIEFELLESENGRADEGPLGWFQIGFGLDRLQSDLRQSLAYSLVIVALVLFGGVVVTILVCREILTPLNNLVRAAEGIEGGRFETRAPENAPAEFGKLSRVFNRMASFLEQHTARLEQQVAQRTIQLREHAETLERRNEELRAATEQANAANRAKSEFLANMSHEIRTPMTAILGFCDQLCEGDLEPLMRREAAATVRRNSDHLLGLINDILDLSRIESGKLDLERLPCSPAQIVCEISSLFRPRAIEKGLRLVARFETPLPDRIHTDPTRLRQVLLNLVGNAVKFTSRGEVCIAVRDVGSTGAAQGAALRFSVQDTGPGIAPEHLSNLFNPFEQGDTSMSRRHGGAGLGLSISRRLSEMLGGRIEVESTPGVGSTFALTLRVELPSGVVWSRPAAEGSPKPAACDASPSPPSRGDSTTGSSRAAEAGDPLDCRILLAEDGPDNQRLISAILRKAGAVVEIAENGRIAMQRVLDAAGCAGAFDLVLMDMQMPELDGYEATRRLREAGCRIPIIALTAHAMSGDRARCLTAGCDDYDTKPIRREHLLALIRRHVRQPVES